MTVKLLNDLVMIRPLLPDAPKTAWGFELPRTEDAQETAYKGEVLAVGPGKPVKYSEELIKEARNLIRIDRAVAALARLDEAADRQKMQVKAGDIVIYSKHGHQKFKVDGEEVIVCHEDSIMGVIENG